MQNLSKCLVRNVFIRVLDDHFENEQIHSTESNEESREEKTVWGERREDECEENLPAFSHICEKTNSIYFLFDKLSRLRPKALRRPY